MSYENSIKAFEKACTLMPGGVNSPARAFGAVGGCMSAGNNRMKKTGIYFPMGGSVVMLGGLFMIWRRYQAVYTFVTENNKTSRATPITADGAIPPSILAFGITAFICLSICCL